MASAIDIVSPTYVRQFVNEWELLHLAQYKNELKIAELAKKIHDIFRPHGAAGDEQFMQFVREHLKHCHAAVTLAKATSFEVFTSEDWLRFGGWKGIGLLLRLRPADRKRLIAKMPGQGPYSRPVIDKLALEAKIDLPLAGRGRPGRAEAEAKNKMLNQQLDDMTEWFTKLYSMRADLPPPPNRLREELVRRSRTSRPGALFGARA